MAKNRNKFNAKARKNKTVVVDQSDTNQIKVDLQGFASEKYDDSNALVLPSKKRKTIHKAEKGLTERFLSKKQRKKLKVIVERREKKSNRADLLEELQKHQLPAETFAKLTPLVQIQTEGLKKLFSESARLKQNKSASNPDGTDLSKKPKSSLKGANKFKSWSGRFAVGKSPVAKDNPKVLGLNEDEDDSDSSSESDQMEEDNTPNLPCFFSSKSVDEIEKLKATTVEKDTEHVQQKKGTMMGEANGKKEVINSEQTFAAKKAKLFVKVDRLEEIEKVRSKLPIIPEEQVIMESITENLVVVLAGETGSGKTTQVPQFLYEAGYASDGKLIGITEPRRVAAISMSHRVAKELNLTSDIVSYQIRFEGNSTKNTKIKFMTDGVLLKEMEKDFLLSKYSCICIDEAHERSLYTDILIGLLSRCVLARNKRGDPLKLIIMSATMRVDDFIKNSILFKKPPNFIHIPTRQFPVQVHFNKKTPDNYLVAALKKTVQIHRKLPSGGILVFVTGQQDAKTLIKQLQRIFPSTADCDDVANNGKLKVEIVQAKVSVKGSKSKENYRLKSFDLANIQALPLQAEESDDEVHSDDEVDEFSNLELDEESTIAEPLHVLPLYSMLPSSEQQKVFEPPPNGVRLCVVATNVAETSLTIPSIRYVVDCGKVKLKVWDKLTGVQQFKISWCSKASSEQRAGRAGRTGPGHCYRLYSSAVFDSDFDEYSSPEIQVRPIDDMMLLMKSMSIDRVRNFPYPTHPGEEQLISAENTLLSLGALEIPSKFALKNRSDDISTITDLGKTMSHFPLGPRFAKMIALSFNHSLVEYTITLVAALTVQEVFLDSAVYETNKDAKHNWNSIRQKWAGTGSPFLLGDCMVLLRAVGAFEFEGGSPEICLRMGLRYKAMIEIRKLRKQLTLDINTLLGQDEALLNPKMKPPTETEATLLRQIVLSGLPDKIARRIQEGEIKDGEDKKIYKNAYRCGELQDPVFLHSSSVLRSQQPEWVVYQEVFESNEKMFLRGVTAIEPEWIPIFCEKLCRKESPLKEPPPFYDDIGGIIKGTMKITYGKQAWDLPLMKLEYPRSLEKYKIFAQFLLEGKVFPKLDKYKSHLLSLPATMTKPWAKLQPRTQTLLQALAAGNIDGKQVLVNKWNEDKSFLLSQYSEWIPTDMRGEIVMMWPPIDSCH